MWQDKKNIAIAFTFSVLALLTFWSIDTGVWADEFSPPPGPPPSGNVGLNFLSNPLNTDLDLNNNNILSANEVHTNSLIISTGHLDINSNTASAGEEKWAFKGGASKNFAPTGHTYGVYGHAGTGSYAGYFDGLVYLSNGGQLYVETTGNTSPIVGVAAYNANNAGVQGYGNVGMYGGGDAIGVYGYGEQGVLAKGARTMSVVPPPGGEWGGEEPVDNGNIASLFGINKVQAAVGNYTAYTIGLVAAGGSNGGASLTHAGLGLCALSGAKDFALGANPDYYTYCQDVNAKNNYAGFFAGDIYIKDGSVQLNGALANSNENLLYANADSAVNNSHLLKLQTGFADKFKVDKDGAVWSASSLTTNGDVNINTGSLFFNDGASYIDFRGGDSGPACKAGDEGIVYYFTNYNALCLCQGADGWVDLVPGQDNGMCTNGVYMPS